MDAANGVTEKSMPLAITIDDGSGERPLHIDFTTTDVVRHHEKDSWIGMSDDDKWNLSEDYGCYLARTQEGVQEWAQADLDGDLFEEAKQELLSLRTVDSIESAIPCKGEEAPAGAKKKSGLSPI